MSVGPSSVVNAVPLASPTGGATPYPAVTSAAGNNATLVKATAGQLYGAQIFNTTSTIRYVNFYDKSTAPVPSTDSANLRKIFAIPGGTNGAGDVIPFPMPVAFLNGIGFTITTTPGGTDTAVGAGDVILNLDYN